RYLVALSGTCSLVGPSETTCPPYSFSGFTGSSCGVGGNCGTCACGAVVLDRGPPGRMPCNCDRFAVVSDTTCGGRLGGWKSASLATPRSKPKWAATETATAIVSRLPRRTGCCGKGMARLL